MYKLNLMKIAQGSISGIEGYNEFLYPVLPEVGQWLSLPSKDHDSEAVYNVVQIALHLYIGSDIHATVYVTPFQNIDQAEESLHQKYPTE